MMHALQHGPNSGVILAPEIIGNCIAIQSGSAHIDSMVQQEMDIQDKETAGPSATVPGIVGDQTALSCRVAGSLHIYHARKKQEKKEAERKMSP